MSDFLDRVAARAIGSEATLAPRLPSLFEPLQRAPLMPSVDEAESPSPRREVASELQAAPLAGSLRPSPAATALQPEPPRAARVERAAAPMQTIATAPSPQSASPQPHVVAATRIVERVEVSPSRTAHPTEVAPVQPRQTRVAPERIETAPPPARGALLPDPAPVFASSRVAPASGRSGSAVTSRPPVASNASQHTAPSEPIVHVSIGRLEVRAAPSAAAPPRRRDGPQPSSLDDYLRQRGKVSP